MDFSAIAAATGVPPATASGVADAKLADNFDTFLTLLTAQLEHQDPLEPMDANQFTDQLVQFTEVEQSIAANKNLEKLLALVGTNSTADAVSYLGKTVEAVGRTTSLTSGKADWRYHLPETAESTTVTITNAAGKLVYSTEGEVAAGNITNVNTIGYKTTRAAFSTLVTNSGSATKYSPGGVSSSPQGLIDRQGLLQASTSPTDLAVTGQGFFVVNTDQVPTSTTGAYLYTRAGSFSADSNGYLRNTGGYYAQGYPYDTNGNLPSNRALGSLETVNISNLTGTAAATRSLSLSANLNSDTATKAYTFGNMSAGTTTPDFERSVQVIDSKGGVRALTFGFVRNNALAANQWSVEIYANPATDVTNTNGLLNAVGTSLLAFNTDGTVDTATSNLPASLSITTWAAALGVANSTIALDFGTNSQADGMTQFSTPSNLISSETNGAVFGALTGVSVSEEGVVTALFDNGTRKDIYKMPLALFPNVNGLEG
ncbi:MAG: flagellar hook-basal body complex protein, partial [Rhodospirillaceae bacterium]|nr:flagellar hook-basal body complex protein [Rhodospirillaceae bacterium]